MSLDSFARFRALHFHDEALGFSLDVSRIRFADGFVEGLEPRLQKAYEAMNALENGAIANPDEKRQVGHYRLRAYELAARYGARQAIVTTVSAIAAFAHDVHHGAVRPEKAAKFRNVLVV